MLLRIVHRLQLIKPDPLLCAHAFVGCRCTYVYKRAAEQRNNPIEKPIRKEHKYSDGRFHAKKVSSSVLI